VDWSGQRGLGQPWLGTKSPEPVDSHAAWARAWDTFFATSFRHFRDNSTQPVGQFSEKKIKIPPVFRCMNQEHTRIDEKD